MILDYLIVFSLLLFPHTFFMNYSTSIFPSLRFQQMFCFGIPVLLLIIKFRKERGKWNIFLFKKTVKYFLFVLYGMLVALFYTDNRIYELSFYSQILFWMVLVVSYLCLSRNSSSYHINLIRLFFVHLSVVSIVFYVSYGFFGARWPLFDTYGWGDENSVIPFAGLSLEYSNSPWFAGLVPRFTFLFQEPRIIGIRMPLGLFLQKGFMSIHDRIWSPRQKLLGKLVVFSILMSMMIIFSGWGYISLIIAILLLFWERIFRSSPSSYYSVLFFIIISFIGILFILGLSNPITVTQFINTQIVENGGGVVDFLETKGGKEGIAEGEFTDFVFSNSLSLFNIFYFPLGTGLLPQDDEYYYDLYGIHVGGGLGSIGYFICHAGIIGLFFLFYIFNRTIKALKTIYKLENYADKKYFLIMVVFTMVFSTIGNLLNFTTILFFNLFITELIFIELQSSLKNE